MFVLLVAFAAPAPGSASVFWHGVVISSLPPTLTRLLIAVAVLGGLAAATLGFLADEPGTVRR
jgi:hypothetical protein